MGSSYSRDNEETIEKSSVRLVISDIVVILHVHSVQYPKEEFEDFDDFEEHEDEDNIIVNNDEE